MQKLIQVLWPSFLVAAVVEAVFFTVIDPQALYLLGEPVHYDPLTTYSIGFLAFWLICAAICAERMSEKKPTLSAIRWSKSRLW